MQPHVRFRRGMGAAGSLVKGQPTWPLPPAHGFGFQTPPPSPPPLPKGGLTFGGGLTVGHSTLLPLSLSRNRNFLRNRTLLRPIGRSYFWGGVLLSGRGVSEPSQRPARHCVGHRPPPTGNPVRGALRSTAARSEHATAFTGPQSYGHPPRSRPPDTRVPISTGITALVRSHGTGVSFNAAGDGPCVRKRGGGVGVGGRVGLGWVVACTGGGLPRPACPSLTGACGGLCVPGAPGPSSGAWVPYHVAAEGVCGSGDRQLPPAHD